MRLKWFFLVSICFNLMFVACKDDDDDGFEPVPIRDRGEQAIEDEEALNDYLESHFYNYEEFENPGEDFDYTIRIDTIDENNADKQPLIESERLIVKTIERSDVEYTYYILKVREGAGHQPTFADSTFANYKGQLLNRYIFDQAVNPIWFDLPGYDVLNNNGQAIRRGGTITGFAQALTEFRAATGYEVNPDNTVSWNNDYGIGAAFIPSGLAYFSSSSGRIPPYSPLVFSFQLFRVNEADHDGDGIPSWMEDLDGDGILFNDDTDEDGLSNHSDTDDDGDGTSTREEIIINEDGTIEFPDSNNNGVPDYLDPDSFKN